MNGDPTGGFLSGFAWGIPGDWDFTGLVVGVSQRVRLVISGLGVGFPDVSGTGQLYCLWVEIHWIVPIRETYCDSWVVVRSSISILFSWIRRNFLVISFGNSEVFHSLDFIRDLRWICVDYSTHFTPYYSLSCSPPWLIEDFWEGHSLRLRETIPLPFRLAPTPPCFSSPVLLLLLDGCRLAGWWLVAGCPFPFSRTFLCSCSSCPFFHCLCVLSVLSVLNVRVPYVSCVSFGFRLFWLFWFPFDFDSSLTP